MSSERPEGWRDAKLGEIAALSGGTTPSKSNEAYWINGTVPWATPSDITSLPSGQTRIATTQAHVAECSLKECSLKLNPPGTVLMTSRATIGYAVINDVPMATNQGFLNFTCSGDSDAEFLCQWLNANRGLLTDAAGGSTFKEISRSTAKLLPIFLPPFDEQRRIGEVLRSVDQAIARAADALSQTVEARTHQLERLMALPGEMRPLSDICRLGGGYGFPIEHQGKRTGAYPFAKVSDMNRLGNETELATAENYVDEADLKLLRAKPFPPGTTLFPKVGATLLTNKRRIASREIIVDNNVMGAVPTGIDPWFLFYAFNTIDMADYVQPGAVPSVNQRTVGTIMLPVPTEEVQAKYVGTMRDLDRAIGTQRAGITALASTKSAVTSDLLSGRVRVPA